jgi:hypothetical protein
LHRIRFEFGSICNDLVCHLETIAIERSRANPFRRPARTRGTAAERKTSFTMRAASRGTEDRRSVAARAAALFPIRA